jgi:hypothetical protein
VAVPRAPHFLYHSFVTKITQLQHQFHPNTSAPTAQRDLSEASHPSHPSNITCLGIQLYKVTRRKNRKPIPSQYCSHRDPNPFLSKHQPECITKRFKTDETRTVVVETTGDTAKELNRGEPWPVVATGVDLGPASATVGTMLPDHDV